MKYLNRFTILLILICISSFSFSQTNATVQKENTAAGILATNALSNSLTLSPTTITFPVLTTTAINNIPSPKEGMVVYDQTMACLKQFNGSIWSCIGGKNPAFNIYASDVTLTALNDYILFTASPPLNSPRFFVTLPAASSMPGKTFIIINHSFATLNCSPYRFGPNASNFNDIADNSEVYLISDGTNWRKYN